MTAAAIGRRALLRSCATAATIAAASAIGAGQADAATSTTVLRYATRPDLTPPRVVIAGTSDDDPALPGYFLLTAEGSTGQQGLLILDRRGEVVWFRPAPRGGIVKNLNVQRYRGRPVLTWWEGTPGKNNKKIGFGTGYVAGPDYRLIAVIRAGAGLQADFHELNLTSRGTALITAFPTRHVSLSAVGGPRHGFAGSGVVQEIDIATGKVLFHWESLDHVPLTESLASVPKSGAYDYFHVNSVAEADDGDLLISSRNTCTVYKVNRATGKIRWRLGGRNSDFKMGPGAAFWWQHHVRPHGPGTLSLFDNGASPPREPRSRGIVLDLDMSSMTASLRAAFASPIRTMSANQGSVQLLPDGGALVGWGNQPAFSQFGSDGKVVLAGQLPYGDYSYRAYAGDWAGLPRDRPAVAVHPSGAGVVVSMSWNGATGVKAWRVSAEHAVRVVPRQSFETSVWLPGRPGSVTVLALDQNGRALGTAKVTGQGTHGRGRPRARRP